MNTKLEDEAELKPPDLVQLGKAILNNKALADEKANITWTPFSISYVWPLQKFIELTDFKFGIIKTTYTT